MALRHIVACIDAGLDDVELQQATGFNRERYRILGFRLRVLKKFVLTICSRNLGREESFKHLLVKIIDNIRSMALDNHHSLHLGWDVTINPHVFELKAMLYWNSTRGGCCTTDDVLEMITSILEALLDLRSVVVSPHLIENAQESIEELEEQMPFMKGLISLAGETSAEPLRVLFYLAVSFYSKAVFSLFTFQVPVSIGSKILQDMKPMYAALARALSNTKLMSMAMDDAGDDAFVAVQRFLDPLVLYLWHIIRLDHRAVSFEDLQELFVGIRSLRAILKLQHNLNVKIKQQIANAVCEAGAITCSLHCSQYGIRLQNLLDSINAILIETGPPEPHEDQLPTATSIRVDELKTSPALTSNLATLITGEGVVGFHEEEILAVDQLTRGSMQLQMLAIV